MFLEKTWYISCGFTGFVLSLQVPKLHGKHQGLPENCWYLLGAEPFYSQDSCEGPKRYPHKSWRRWSCQCHRRCKSEHMPTPCYLAGEEPMVSIFRKPYREYLRIGCLEFRNHYSNLIRILFVCQGYRYSGNIGRQELWPTVANKLNWFAAKRKFRQQNHIQKHIFLEDRCVLYIHIGMGWYGPKRVWVIGFSTPKWWLQVLQMSNSLLHLYTCGIMRIWYVCTKILLYMHKTGGGSNVNMYLYLHNTKNNDTLLDINRICRLLKYLCITVYIYIQLIATKT